MVAPDPDSLYAVLAQSHRLGLLGPGPIESHVLHAREFSAALAMGSSVLDLGSGGGVPGLVLVAERADLSVTLLDASARRVAFLRSAVRTLGASGRATVVEGRAESLAHTELREQFDAVTARSFAAAAPTAECAAGFVRVGGRVVISEPPGGPERWDDIVLARLGLSDRGTVQGEHATLRTLEKVARLGADWPRANGLPDRRRLF